jgi:DNA-binding NtrC family response regulator
MSKQGVFDYIAKPCNADALASAVRRAAEERVAIAEEADAFEGGTGPAISVLLVDDEIDFLDSLARILRRRNLVVHLATSGADALDQLSRVPIDVVVLDVKMPGLDGLEVLDRVRAADPYAEVLLLTGLPTVKTAVEGMRRGASEYLTKPPEIPALLLAIRSAARRRRKRLEERQARIIDDVLDRYVD